MSCPGLGYARPENGEQVKAAQLMLKILKITSCPISA